MKQVFQKETFLSAPPEAVFAFHEHPEAFRILSPPSFNVDVRSTASTLRPSEDIVRFNTNVMGLSFPFAMVHTVYRPPGLFVDEQLIGFFSYWKHEHRFLRGGWREDPATLLRDRIEYSHPLLIAGNFVVKGRLGGLFEFRHDATRRELAEAMRGGPTTGRVVVTGATGLIGRRLVEVLVDKGIEVTALVRSPERSRSLFDDSVTTARWDFTKPEKGNWRDHIDGADAVVHLAGTPLFAKRWTPDFKKEMEESRTLSTRQLVEAISAAKQRPKVLINASAQGIYGVDPERLVREGSAFGDDILSRICIAWEKEARAVEAAGVRSVQARIGIVLSPESGALKEMLPFFKLGFGGVLGSPSPWINWIHLEDCVRMLLMALLDESLEGPLNVVSPHPVPNKTFAHTLARVLRRPCLARYPEALMRLVMGEAGSYSSGGPRVTADLAEEHGYEFFYDELEPALRNLLCRPAP